MVCREAVTYSYAEFPAISYIMLWCSKYKMNSAYELHECYCSESSHLCNFHPAFLILEGMISLGYIMFPHQTSCQLLNQPSDDPEVR
jgi:hypothetical protein